MSKNCLSLKSVDSVASAPPWIPPANVNGLVSFCNHDVMRCSRSPRILHPLLITYGCLFVGLLLPQPCSAAVPKPEPIVATTSSDFLGYDGSWSAVSLRVGTPEQWLYVLPSTLSQETWVVGPAGCDGTSTCQNKRGGLFSANMSSTFDPKGLFELNLDPSLSDDGSGYYGLDTIALDDITSVPNQIVALVNSTDQWIGSLGLGVQQTRFTGDQNNLPFLSSLVQNGSYIPSHSYGYTAGASYRESWNPLWSVTTDKNLRTQRRPCFPYTRGH
jgi:hypothetical protein